MLKYKEEDMFLLNLLIAIVIIVIVVYGFYSWLTWSEDFDKKASYKREYRESPYYSYVAPSYLYQSKKYLYFWAFRAWLLL
jgi:hypothetical protein